MPSTMMPAGWVACRLASATAASMLRPGRVSGSKRAAAALPCSRCLCTRWALLSGSSGISQRSSTRAMSTRSQRSGACDSARNTGAGVLPPDTSSRARGRSSRSRRRAAAIATAAAQDHWSSLRNSCRATGAGGGGGRVRTSGRLFTAGPRPPWRRPASPVVDAARRTPARAPSPPRSGPSPRNAGGRPGRAESATGPVPGRH